MFPIPNNILSRFNLGTATTGAAVKIAITEVATWKHSVAIMTEDGYLVTHGDNTNGECGTGDRNAVTGYHVVDAGDFISRLYNGDKCFIFKTVTGDWKYLGNTQGLIGGENNYALTPTDLPSTITNTINLDDVKHICGTPSATFYLMQDGSLYASGTNAEGMMGLGTTNNYDTPQLITTGVVTISPMIFCLSLLKDDGRVYYAGRSYGIGGGEVSTSSLSVIGTTTIPYFGRDLSATPYGTVVITSTSAANTGTKNRIMTRVSISSNQWGYGISGTTRWPNIPDSVRLLNEDGSLCGIDTVIGNNVFAETYIAWNFRDSMTDYGQRWNVDKFTQKIPLHDANFTTKAACYIGLYDGNIVVKGTTNLFGGISSTDYVIVNPTTS